MVPQEEISQHISLQYYRRIKAKGMLARIDKGGECLIIQRSFAVARELDILVVF